MAKSSNQKLKLLYLMKLLLEKSDESHPVTVAQMIAFLGGYGIKAERKSIYDDLELLRTFGIDIVSIKGKSTGYFAASREFELPELKLLVDAASSAKFITEKKSRELIAKLSHLTSDYEASKLQRQVYVTSRNKAFNEKIYYNVDEIHRAIAEDREITFMYFEMDLDKNKVYKNGGELYRVSPFALSWDDENYYMIAKYAKHEGLSHFRVDKMESITVTEARRKPLDEGGSFDPGVYTKKIFDMFWGEERTVRLQFANDLIGVALDRFGGDIIIVKGEGSFTVNVKVAVSPSFFAWVFKFGEKVKILSPDDVVQKMKLMLLNGAALYADQK